MQVTSAEDMSVIAYTVPSLQETCLDGWLGDIRLPLVRFPDG